MTTMHWRDSPGARLGSRIERAYETAAKAGKGFVGPRLKVSITRTWSDEKDDWVSTPK